MNAIMHCTIKEIDIITDEIDQSFFTQPENRLIFDYILILSDLCKNKLSKEVALIKLKKLIAYPNILSNKQILSVAEFIILGEILTLLPSYEQVVLLNSFKKILKNPLEAVVGNDEKLVILLLIKIIKTLSVSKKHDDMLYYCLKGIKICKVTHSNYHLDYLYYSAALCYNGKNMTNARDEMIFKAIITIHTYSDSCNTKKMINLIEKQFNINVTDFIKTRF